VAISSSILVIASYHSIIPPLLKRKCQQKNATKMAIVVSMGILRVLLSI